MTTFRAAPLVVVVDDDAAIRLIVSEALSRAGFRVEQAQSVGGLERAISAHHPDLVVSDVGLPDGSLFEWLPRLKKRHPALPIVVMSAQNTFMTALRAAELGAHDYLAKPFDLDELVRLARAALTLGQGGVAQAGSGGAEGAQNTAQAGNFEENLPFIGRSAPMQALYRTLARLMGTQLPVLITGEAGTGKALAARALHDFGKRRQGPFIAVSVAALPRDQVSAALFGRAHPDGSVQAGACGQAQGGTLFVDEIGDLPMEAQTRLLQVLQTHEFQPLDTHTAVRADFRFVAASRHALAAMVAEEKFREDLYYRLSIVPLRMPPLRERADDIADLVRHFAHQAALEGLPVKRFSHEALAYLQELPWKGNIRELESVVQRLIVMHPEARIGLRAVEHALADRAPAPTETGGGTLDLEAIEATFLAYLEGYIRLHAPAMPPGGMLARFAPVFERPLLLAALKASDGVQLQAADLLGINRNTLRKKMRELGLRVTGTVDAGDEP